MKTFAFIATAAACFAATQVAAYDETTPCPDSELIKLISLASEPTLTQCEADSGYTFIPPAGVPTSDEVFLMCLSSACNTTITALLALNPSDCLLTVGSVSLNVLELAESYATDCAALG